MSCIIFEMESSFTVSIKLTEFLSVNVIDLPFIMIKIKNNIFSYLFYYYNFVFI